jgi:hypothetical protein
MKRKIKFGTADWLRRYPELGSQGKKSDRGRTIGDQERAERKRRLDLIADARQLGNELGEVWDD